jgi:hypothetical protein
MRIPKKVLIIGEVEFILYSLKGKNHVQNHHFHSKDPFLVATNPDHTSLFIFESKPSGKKRILRDRHGNQRGFIHTEIEYSIPAIILQNIGKVHSIQYRTEWWSQQGAILQHIFETPPKMFAEKQTRFKVIGIKGRGKIIGSDGIKG